MSSRSALLSKLRTLTVAPSETRVRITLGTTVEAHTFGKIVDSDPNELEKALRERGFGKNGMQSLKS